MNKFKAIAKYAQDVTHMHVTQTSNEMWVTVDHVHVIQTWS
jgi:hypothetical protein